MLGVSSMYSGAFERAASLVSSCCQSHGSSLAPPFSLSAGRPDSVVISLITSWRADISRENTATGMLLSTAAFLARLSAKAVLPTEGRAASMIRSDFCHPRVTLSNEGNPEGTPLKPSIFWFFSTSRKASLMMEPTSWTSFLRLFWIAL